MQPFEEGRRIARCITFVRETADDNGYARPVEGLLVHVDLGRGEGMQVVGQQLVDLLRRRRLRLHALGAQSAHQPLRQHAQQ